jgi:hypothetical protein
MPDEFLKQLREEIFSSQQRRIKITIIKITFVSTLLGFGNIKIKDIIEFYHVLYLVPLVTVFFDMLIMGESYSIKRIGAFLRLASHGKERTYEEFVSKNRDKYFKYGSNGFSILSIVAAFFLLNLCPGNGGIFEYVWFIAILIAYLLVIYFGTQQHKKLDGLKELKMKSPNKANAANAKSRAAD